MTDRLPVLVTRAAQVLAAATTAAEVLDARDAAGFAYDAAKAAARFAKAKGAHDELIAAAHRAQADALEIEASAKRRLADEYDAAQERGEVQRHGGQGKRDVPEENIPSVIELGLTRKAVHEARRLRDAEATAPGIIRHALDACLDQGQEPTKAAVNKVVSNVIQMGDRLKPVATVEDIEREGEAEQAAEEILSGPQVDLDSLEGRARAFNGAVSVLDLIKLTGPEWLSFFNKDPARALYVSWIKAAHKKLELVLTEARKLGL